MGYALCIKALKTRIENGLVWSELSGYGQGATCPFLELQPSPSPWLVVVPVKSIKFTRIFHSRKVFPHAGGLHYSSIMVWTHATTLPSFVNITVSETKSEVSTLNSLVSKHVPLIITSEIHSIMGMEFKWGNWKAEISDSPSFLWEVKIKVKWSYRTINWNI